ncbi:Puromycin-sensitive aminopeptidase [Nymphon striatum]|nr:Puromycin-sensitive aminopeptidase [Nymphon striatum]
MGVILLSRNFLEGVWLSVTQCDEGVGFLLLSLWPVTQIAHFLCRPRVVFLTCVYNTIELMIPSKDNTMPSSLPFARLPKTVIPKKYFVTLKPNILTKQCEGSVKIELEVKESVDVIKLNAVFLDILTISFEDADGKILSPESYDLNKEDEKLSIKFVSPISVGSGVLQINFSGSLDHRQYGFYISRQTSASGEEDLAAVTHFEINLLKEVCVDVKVEPLLQPLSGETFSNKTANTSDEARSDVGARGFWITGQRAFFDATYARRAFPCWDEPEFKAEFNVTLIVSRDVTALSNMNVISDMVKEDELDFRVVKFASTPMMSTYLVAFIVGKFGFVEDTTDKGVILRVYTPRGKEQQGKFALDVLKKCLLFYEKYFGIDYSLPKIDLIAISDFPIGAMENWGLVTYREGVLLVDESGTSIERKQLVAREWWTDLWLKEGFASFMEFFCVDNILPEFDIMSSFWLSVFDTALQTDSLVSSHPIEVKVENPADINSIFDEISYDKGASLLRMLHEFIGDQKFKDGLRYYLKKFSNKNTETEDLWSALNHSSGQPIAEIMSTWTKQKGYPVVFVSSKMKGNKRVLTLNQKKFNLSHQNHENNQWMVPISFTSQSNPKKIIQEFILKNESAEIEFENIPADHWIKLNIGTVGFYRVQYSSSMLEQFISGIQDGTVPSFDRLGLLSDLFVFMLNGSVETVEVLKFMKNFVEETSLTVWSSIIKSLHKLDKLLESSESLEQFHKFGCLLLSKIYLKVGWDPKPNEKKSDSVLRAIVLETLVSFQHKEVLEKAHKKFDEYISGSISFPPSLRYAVYLAVINDGNESTFSKMCQLYKDSDLPEEISCIAKALGGFKNPSLLEEVLKFSISDNVRSQNTLHIVISVSRSSSEGRMLAWNFFKKNINLFIKCYHPGRGLSYFLQDFETITYIEDGFMVMVCVEVFVDFAVVYPELEACSSKAVKVDVSDCGVIGIKPECLKLIRKAETLNT